MQPDNSHNNRPASLFLSRKKSFVSYASNSEDVLLRRVFPADTGFYIDIGANNPVGSSVTYSFYQRGWHGIAIDPVAPFAQKFKKRRPRDIFLSAALSDRNGEITFYSFRGGNSFSTTVEEIAKSLSLDLDETYEKVSVPVFTLDEVYKKYGFGREIDFVKIDVEGAEAAVLRGANLKTLRPKLIVIEAVVPFQQIDSSFEASEILEKSGYQLAYHDGLNKYFVAKEHAELAEKLKFQPGVFDNYITIKELRLKNKVSVLKKLSWTLILVILILGAVLLAK